MSEEIASRCGAAMKGGDIIVEGKLGYQSTSRWPHHRLGGAGASCADALWDGQVWVLGDIDLLEDTQVVEPEPEEAASVETLLAGYGLNDSAHNWRKVISSQRLWYLKVGCKRMADDLTDPIAFHSRRLRRSCQVERWRHLCRPPGVLVFLR